MTLAELRAQLDALNLPDDTPVVVATDAEGNGFSPLHLAVDGMYEAHNDYIGQWYATAEQRAAANDGEWDEAPDHAVPAIFLWPTS